MRLTRDYRYTTPTGLTVIVRDGNFGRGGPYRYHWRLDHAAAWYGPHRSKLDCLCAAANLAGHPGATFGPHEVLHTCLTEQPLPSRHIDRLARIRRRAQALNLGAAA